jgi:RNA polymerase sigma factor (sigma-70 family)
MSLFATTRWSMVQASRRPNARGRRALDQLCRRYRPAVVAYLRHRGLDADSAEELTQSFFVHLLESGLHGHADPDRGGFRAFLLTALRNHVANHFRSQTTQRRGGGFRQLGEDSLDRQLDESAVSPETAFERAWAMTIVDHARHRLAQEAASQGKQALFERLAVFLTERPEGDDYADLGKELGMSRNAVAAAVRRLRIRHRELVDEEISDTLVQGGSLTDERRFLASRVID